MRTTLRWRFFKFRARREGSADLAKNRDSRRSRTPLAAESMNAKSPTIGSSALMPGTRWCKKKIVAISFEEGVVFRVEDQLFKIASSCHNAWTGCNIMILKHFPLSPTPLSSLLSRTCRGTDKLGTPTCHHP